ncbi:MAG: NAD(P)/FAD-dependent oxidoreductase [Gammaproteobacteria bacterium]|nr:NAD(P)/FAD-dependent oxidoreductase [Gammaproteobacteria bacterium]
MLEKTDIAIIGAGPAGAIAAALLCRRGHRVMVLEQARFPRFSIGESLLPQCMEFIDEAGMTDAVARANFQYKNGAAFVRRGASAAFDFRKKFSPGPGTTYQVQRAVFDQLLAQQAAEKGAVMRFGHRIEQFTYTADGRPCLTVRGELADSYQVVSDFVLDASGFGRVLPRLLNLEIPSTLTSRTSVFTHIEDNIGALDYDRDKILIAIHPHQQDVWYWLIPFSNGRCSVGVVAEPEFFEADKTPEQLLRGAIKSCPELASLLKNARFDTPTNRISGYSCNVKSLWGDRFALLGNAGEFLDPVFSSGVTIAMKSASLAAPLVSRELLGDTVDWEQEYARPLKVGVETFRTYVTSWYDGSFQDVIFSQTQQPEVRAMISSILAGYAWDTDNPFVKESRRRLDALVSLCQ